MCVCVWGGGGVQNIYSYIAAMPAVEQWYTFVLPHYIEYHASKRPTEHDNLPVLIQYIETGRPFFALSIDTLRHTGSDVWPF